MTTILIIEDEQALRDEVVDWLQFEDYDVKVAQDGQQGLALAFDTAPDLIICDIAMPELDGYGVLLELRAAQRLQDTPFIFLTAAADYQSMRYGMNLGADDYLTKPFKRADLLNAIETRLNKHQKQQHAAQEYVAALEADLAQKDDIILLKSRMVGMFSHDFRNPLTAILSSAQLIEQYEDRLTTERKHKHLRRIQGAVQLLLQMLDDMLTVTEMESGQLTYQPQNIDVPPFFAEVVEEFQLIHAETHQITLERSFEGLIETDPRLLRRCLSNLISNAVKYSDPGSTVAIIVGNGEAGGIRLVVRDEGIGIPPDELDQLFNAFYRASNSKNRKGTGMGLAIVKEAVERCNGRLNVESVIGVGTTFTIEIPNNGRTLQ